MKIFSDSYANIDGYASDASIAIRSAAFVAEANMFPPNSFKLLAVFIVVTIAQCDCAPQYGYAYYPVDYYVLIAVSEPPVTYATSQELPTSRILCNFLSTCASNADCSRNPIKKSCRSLLGNKKHCCV